MGTVTTLRFYIVVFEDDSVFNLAAPSFRTAAAMVPTVAEVFGKVGLASEVARVTEPVEAN